ncbi:hypothetical protein K461DRAFT_265311 [Myriangium duriaei CBS 260.36]|uniref:Zn(2)-C6 fungal-type domain-containing protein n=1 Tax=Myriangium duriaei CBS 260.36 TaxID=1168546 RepID=A0A9P4MJY9_9PEZI|nr:hypothetical protein K461DRAFT_265311 [Myriangium duriaei CBS 260.36]
MAAAVVMHPLATQPDTSYLHSPRPSSTDASTPRAPMTTTTKKTVTPVDGKRFRAERPCDGCRRRKSKCVIQDSAPCILCKAHKQECTFVQGPLPRKRKVDDDSVRDGPLPKVAKTTTQAAQRPAVQKAPHGQSSTQVAKPDHIRPDPLATLDHTLSLQRHRHCRHIGSSSALDMSFLGHCQYGMVNEAALDFGDVRRVSPDGFFEMLPDAAFPTHEDELQALYEVEQIVAPNGSALIDLYFEKVHPSYPIIQKRTFVDIQGYRDRQFSSALLAAMYILAIRWWYQDPVLAQQPIPSVPALEAVAVRSLDVAFKRPKLSSLQAALLLLQRQHPNAWPLTVQVVALSQDLGLHLDCTDWEIPLWERRLRRRLSWAVYMQDKWSSLIFGRPSHIHSSDWAVVPLTLDDFNEEVVTEGNEADADVELTDDEDYVNIFLQMIELTSIMSEVVDTFYTQVGIAEIKRGGNQATQLILSKAKPVQLKLKEWFGRLPAYAKMDAENPPASVGYLHLAYFATEISIHRRIVQSLSPAGTRSAAENYALYICRSAAKTRLISAMDFVNRLKPEHLDAFWFFASANNFALIATFGNLLRVTAPGYEEAEFYEMRLREYRWALAVSSKRARWIGQAVSLLDVTNRMLEGLPEKPRSSQGSPKSRADSAQGREGR